MTDFIVGSNTTSIGLVLVPGDTLEVGGISAIAVDTVDSGAVMAITSGGLMNRTTLDDGAVLLVSGGGSATSGTIDLSSEVLVLSGGSVSNFTVSGLMVLDLDAFADRTVVAQGGVELVQTVVVSGAVAAGGVQDVLRGLDEFGTVAGVQRIFSGTASQDTILSGGFQEINATGTAEVEDIASGAEVFVSRFGTLINSTVESGGQVTVGGESVSDQIGGSETILSGGDEFNTTILSGGKTTISSGGESREGTVEAGGVLTVLAGGLADLNGVNGVEVIGSGGLDLSAFDSSGGLELVSGGTASSDVVESGGKLEVVAGGVVSGALVSGGGKVVVSAGGTLINTSRVESGAVEIVSSGGLASGGEIDPGASGSILAGGREDGATVLGGVTVHGSTTSDFVINGGSEIVFGRGVATLADVNESGTLTASSGAVLISTIIGPRGHEIVSSGGVASFTSVEDGSEVVLGGGVASDTKIQVSGQETVSSGGLATQLTVNSGGSVTVEVGGKVQGLGLASGATLIDSGQVLLGDRNLKGTISGAGAIVESASNGLLVMSTNGAAFDGRTVISGGRIELAVAGAIGTSQVVFLGGAVTSQTLQLDALAAPAAGGTFANTISNFNAANKAIDLRALAFSAGAAATLSGSTLTLVDGGKSYAFTLAGLVGKSFSVAADGSGGTEIIAHATAAFAQAAAVLPGSGLALQSPVSGYGGERASPFHAGTAGGRA